MDREQERWSVEDRDLSGHLLHRRAAPSGALIERPDDGERVVLELLELGQVLGIETVAQRSGLEAVPLGQLAQLILGGLDHVLPQERGIGSLQHRLQRHPWQIRLAAAAAPKPLSMLTTVTP